ncbi:hypothetical protein BKA69DRAFT_1103174 [Paraphysoderma sedebokerense]|nr:hypothetical protein BKA69DRAFT_1103174 [Paraphysoderma sedebokerense]
MHRPCPLEFPSTRLLLIEGKVTQVSIKLGPTTSIEHINECIADPGLNDTIFQYILAYLKVIDILNEDFLAHDGYTDGVIIIFPERKPWALYQEYSFYQSGIELQQNEYKYSFQIDFVQDAKDAFKNISKTEVVAEDIDVRPRTPSPVRNRKGSPPEPKLPPQVNNHDDSGNTSDTSDIDSEFGEPQTYRKKVKLDAHVPADSASSGFLGGVFNIMTSVITTPMRRLKGSMAKKT